jgi:hypothetical protein
MPWYIFRINPPGDIMTPTDYMLVDRRPVCTGNRLCAIHTSDNGFGYPILSNAILYEIATALNNGIESNNVSLRQI